MRPKTCPLVMMLTNVASMNRQPMQVHGHNEFEISTHCFIQQKNLHQLFINPFIVYITLSKASHPQAYVPHVLGKPKINLIEP